LSNIVIAEGLRLDLNEEATILAVTIMTRKPASINSDVREATAFAPATVANVAVGFDVLGFALEGVGDRVRVSVDENPSPPVTIESITGVVTDLPTDPRRNTAAVAVAKMVEALDLRVGLRIALDKGIPLGSGMGGSAASAVGAVVAVNGLLAEPLSPDSLLPFALEGEAAASGAPHADNAAPCLFGGMTAVVATDPLRVVEIPTPEGLACVLVRPELRIDTREARAALRTEIPLELSVAQSMRLTGFLVGCYRDDIDLVGQSMEDLVAGPQRAAAITGFDSAREAALGAGALGFAVAGSGPSVFAWVRSTDDAAVVESAVRGAFVSHGVRSQGWVSRLGCSGAHLVDDPAGR
jgi:homoserine kinase